MSSISEINTFESLGLAPELTETLKTLGYEEPTPIQAQAIPAVLNGSDLLGQAQTGTGKTAAFALPILSNIDIEDIKTQVLVLTPTRELALQVAEAFETYGKGLRGFRVLPVYGGQSMPVQLKALRRGVHVVVGTPGRIMDHVRRKSLRLGELKTVVLDEADEMLKMGFIEDIDWILEHTPADKQVALFSATMPAPIRRVARKHLRDEVEVKIKSKTSTVETITQRYWLAAGVRKLDALCRLLETEELDAAIVFVRTKNSTVELAEQLESRGHTCAALNGDLTQALRERTVNRLKNRQLDVLIATDVAARGLDVERVSHVINFDVPHDTESYVHRIGRTGRAGREGNAIIFVTPRERRMLRAIEQATRQPIAELKLPSTKELAAKRIERFKQKVVTPLSQQDAELSSRIVFEIASEQNLPIEEIAARFCHLAQKDSPLIVKEELAPVRSKDSRGRIRSRESRRERGPRRSERGRHKDDTRRARRHSSGERESGAGSRDGRRKDTRNTDSRRSNSRSSDSQRSDSRTRKDRRHNEPGMETYRIEVGRNHGANPGSIVAAIAENAGIRGKEIGRIQLHQGYSTVDLPEGMPRKIFQNLQSARVNNRPMKICKFGL